MITSLLLFSRLPDVPLSRYNQCVNETCPFCHMDPARIVQKTELTYTIRDGYPISPGHTLIIPIRHVCSFFGVTPEEKEELLRALDAVKVDLDAEFQPDGYNIGINDGSAAGQTVPHLHIHLIPRFNGDQPDPRGGVRWIFPEQANYWDKK